MTRWSARKRLAGDRSAKGTGSKITALSTVKLTVFAPIHNASVSRAVT